MKISDLLMNQVKAYVTLTIELISITKDSSNVAPGGKYPLQNLNSAARATRLVRKFSSNSSRGNACFHRTRSKVNQARSLRKHSPTKSHLHDKTGNKLISRDFLASDCRQQMFYHDSFESGSAGSSLPLNSVFDRLELCIE